MKTSLLYYIACIFLFLIGFLMYPTFIEIIYTNVSIEKAHLVVYSPMAQSMNQVSFALILGVMPLLLKILNRLAKLTRKQRFVTTISGLVGATVAVAYTVQNINNNPLFTNPSIVTKNVSVNIEPATFNTPILYGAVVGFIIATLVFFFINRKKMNTL